MKAKLQLKSEFKSVVIGYNGQSKPLGERDDLDKLAEIARRSGDKSLLKLFEEVPSEEQITAAKADKTVEAINASQQ